MAGAVDDDSTINIVVVIIIIIIIIIIIMGIRGNMQCARDVAGLEWIGT